MARAVCAARPCALRVRCLCVCVCCVVVIDDDDGSEAQGALVYASFKVPRRPCATPADFRRVIAVRERGRGQGGGGGGCGYECGRSGRGGQEEGGREWSRGGDPGSRCSSTIRGTRSTLSHTPPALTQRRTITTTHHHHHHIQQDQLFVVALSNRLYRASRADPDPPFFDASAADEALCGAVDAYVLSAAAPEGRTLR